ncbi:MAG: hypothetical protein QM820_37620 [Minicystis sp.]
MVSSFLVAASFRAGFGVLLDGVEAREERRHPVHRLHAGGRREVREHVGGDARVVPDQRRPVAGEVGLVPGVELGDRSALGGGVLRVGLRGRLGRRREAREQERATLGDVSVRHARLEQQRADRGQGADPGQKLGGALGGSFEDFSRIRHSGSLLTPRPGRTRAGER